MSREKPVVKCVCFDKTFAELKAADIRSVQEAAERFGCSTKCGLCKPYIERMIETGETEFAILPSPPPHFGL